MRPIDADALIDEIKYIAGQDTIMWFDDRKIRREQEVNMAAFIERMPTIDSVPVVRCKDCKHWGMHKRLNVPWCRAMHIDKSANGYCDFAERREDE